ncbi:uncharacterized protein LOC121868895 isoform X1 [Homarus americanus]|nr:uncharacterized protein LOC121868895 isoform X1 [Homarus americanus]XP_042225835.1 uncharacterized protein LOC121868895 isoform X1 [Homarus americanus]
MAWSRDDLMDLFQQYLEGNLVGMIGLDMLCGAECFEGPDVGEGGPPTHALLYRGGVVTVIKANSTGLTSRGLTPYPHVNLTTEHALTVTRTLATLHANTCIEQEKLNKNSQSASATQMRNTESEILSTASTTTGTGESSTKEKIDTSSDNPVERVCVKDKWTAQISQLEIVESNLSIMVDTLQSSGSNERTVRRLEALQSDLPTLTQFLRFASAMQTCKIPSVGPVCVGDIWIKPQDEEEDIVAIRLRGGPELESPPLRDAAWVWLTLLGADTLRDRYMELCDDYCNAFNKVLLRQDVTSRVEEIGYFDVMRDLGENFLHAFMTIIHKFVFSGTWFFDRQLHTDEGLQALVDVISFLVDNGIVGSIFVI